MNKFEQCTLPSRERIADLLRYALPFFEIPLEFPPDDEAVDENEAQGVADEDRGA